MAWWLVVNGARHAMPRRAAPGWQRMAGLSRVCPAHFERRQPSTAVDRTGRCAAASQLLQERDEIFEDFKAACQQEGLQLRFLNGDSPAAQAGDEPLLLVIGADPGQLLRFPAVDGSNSAAAAEVASGGNAAAGGGSSS